jgi:hypothetical protein
LWFIGKNAKTPLVHTFDEVSIHLFFDHLRGFLTRHFLTIRLIPQNKQKISILQNSRSSRRLSVLKEESEDSESVRSSNINPSAASSPIQPEYHSNGKVDPGFHPNGKVDPDFFIYCCSPNHLHQCFVESKLADPKHGTSLIEEKGKRVCN